MSPRRFAPQATRDLEEAAEWIARDNRPAAEAFLRAAIEAAAMVTSKPGLGSARPHLPARFRFWALTRYRYLLVYDATARPVQVLRVVHMARDLPRVLADVLH